MDSNKLEKIYGIFGLILAAGICYLALDVLMDGKLTLMWSPERSDNNDGGESGEYSIPNE